ncbi:class F sortase [Glycomyces buryatensis]|uniref:Class F sortase n=1 Tax=Glycomyces buryatensis TaxID=2570927 RepID=A0A4S8QD84_9ACTN|nr:class F sortase [Glycomyces buryatensis]THV42328.1 class F sortase [Glycomyces buryatensis]
MTDDQTVHRPEPALRPVLTLFLSLLLAGGLGLMIGGVVPVPSFRLPSWPEHHWGDDSFVGFDPTGGEWLDRSVPTRVDVDAVDIHAPLTDLGMGYKGRFEVPPLSQPHLAGWYEGAASPGEFGPTVLFGHVDSDWSGPAVFFPLRDLEKGDEIEAAREDGIVVTYEVTGSESYPKDKLPYEEIFGIERKPGLRLITCGGRFDRKIGDYTENLVVFATYTGHRGATAEDEDRPLHGRKHFLRN